MKIMQKIDVFYVGQLRYVECLTFHKELYNNADKIYAAFVEKIFDSYKYNLGSDYSCHNNLTFNKALECFKDYINSDDVTVVDPSRYAHINNIKKLPYFKTQQFVLMADFLKDADSASEFTLVMNTNNLVDQDRTVEFELISQHYTSDDPAAWAVTWVMPSGHGLNPNMVLLNKKAVSKIKSNWISAYQRFVEEGDLHPEHIETCWYTLLTYCGVQINKIPRNILLGSFRPNMDLETVKRKGKYYIAAQQEKWRKYKDITLSGITDYSGDGTIPYLEINKVNESTWCYNAFHSLSSDNFGNVRPCCMYKPAKNGELRISQSDKLLDQFYNDSIIKLRHELDLGIKSEACSRCWKEEEAGRKSKRVRDNFTYTRNLQLGQPKAKGLAYIELNLGNQCNIRCRTCAPYASSQWVKEHYDVNIPKTISFQDFSKNYKAVEVYNEDSEFWQDLAENLPSLRRIDLYGGEPFLSKKMWQLLQYAKEQDLAKNLEIHFNTNGTIWRDDFEDHFKGFKHINISFSIDGIGKEFEYMRYLANWDTVYDNMKKMRDLKSRTNNMNLSWCVTLSTLNIFSLPEILMFYKSNFQDFGIYLNLVHFPDHFNISNIPDQYKQTLTDRLIHAAEMLPKQKDQIYSIAQFIKNGQSSPELWNQFLESVRKHDVYREQDWGDTFSFFPKIVGYTK
jgi:MoaA/NifB/PqqE/SkfB family radical SAM enzyme